MARRNWLDEFAEAMRVPRKAVEEAMPIEKQPIWKKIAYVVCCVWLWDLAIYPLYRWLTKGFFR